MCPRQSTKRPSGSSHHACPSVQTQLPSKLAVVAEVAGPGRGDEGLADGEQVASPLHGRCRPRRRTPARRPRSRRGGGLPTSTVRSSTSRQTSSRVLGDGVRRPGELGQVPHRLADVRLRALHRLQRNAEERDTGEPPAVAVGEPVEADRHGQGPDDREARPPGERDAIDREVLCRPERHHASSGPLPHLPGLLHPHRWPAPCSASEKRSCQVAAHERGQVLRGWQASPAQHLRREPGVLGEHGHDASSRMPAAAPTGTDCWCLAPSRTTLKAPVCAGGSEGVVGLLRLLEREAVGHEH